MTDEFLDHWAVDHVAGRAKALRAVGETQDSVQLAFAHRTLGVDCRDSGDVEGARRHLGMALRHARRSKNGSIVADVLATRGGTRVILGDPRGGLRDLTEAAAGSTGAALAPILYRLGLARFILGDPAGAIRDVKAAVEILREHGDVVWLPRALQVLAEAEIRLGHLHSASEHLAECRNFLGDDSGDESIRLRGLEAWVAFLRGDLPTALKTVSFHDVASVGEGLLRGRIAIDLAIINLSAGLSDTALEVLDSVDPNTLPPIDATEWRSILSRVLLANGQPDAAYEIATKALKESRRMGRLLEGAEAALTAVQAQSPHDRDTSLSPGHVARSLERAGSRYCVDGWLLAGQTAVEQGRRAVARKAFANGAGYRRNADLLVAASGWLSRAHELDLSGETGILRACATGLDALDDYREIIGSSEARASITHRGGELADLALRHAVHDPRALLTWSERWRATSLDVRPVTFQGEISPAVAMLRDSGRRIAEARAEGQSTEALEKERRALERRVRSEHHQQRAEGGSTRRRFDAAELVARVGDAGFVQIIDIDDVLHVVVVTKGRARHVVVGETRKALELAEAGAFALRKAARTGRFAPGDLGRRFQEAVLGDAVRLLPDGALTISPTPVLHGAPFALMPVLMRRPFSIVPSATQWMRASDVPVPRTKRRALISGPGLLTGGAEVARLAKEYPDATVLRGPDATVAATMKAIDGAKLAHLATHGTFRADSPLFSALEMADGPLSVYELERLKRAPYRTILSACDSGVLAPVGAQEVLGLASALFSLGSAGLVCSIAEVNDEATADLMMRVHAALEAKQTPAEALASVRESGSPVEQATAAAFVALGV